MSFYSLTKLIEVTLKVVTVHFGSAENYSFIYIVRVDSLDAIFALQHLHGLTQRL
jgi:hypothetical protein